MAMKITRVTVKAIKNHSEFKSLISSEEKIKAVEELLQGIYDTLGE